MLCVVFKNYVTVMFWRIWLIRMAFNQLVLCAAEKVARFLGYEGLKERQRQIILEIMKKRDVILCDFIDYHRFRQFIHTIHRRILLPKLLCTRSVSTTSRTKECRHRFYLTSNVQIYLITFQSHKCYMLGSPDP